MPFLRFSRDKRGYENTYLVHTQNRRGKPSRPRVLYWYRTPPGVRVGRPPFDEEARRRIEAQNPDVTFDWPSIIATAFPPPAENEQWRERRRAERAAKQAQRVEEEAALSADHELEPAISGTREADTLATDGALENPVANDIVIETALLEAEPQPASESELPTEIASGASEAVALQAEGERKQDSPMRKRRRGGRRRRRRHGQHPGASVGQTAVTAPGENPEGSVTSDPGSNELSPDSESGEFDANEE